MPDNDVVVADPSVSRRHCAVVVHTGQTCEIHDTASKNGTYLNGRRIDGPTRLAGGDEAPPGGLELGAAPRAERERAQRGELPRAKTRVSRERRASLGREGEDRLAPLALRRWQRVSRARGERRRQHGAHRVGDPAAIGLGDPRGERELMRPEERLGVHERVHRTERPLVGHVERSMALRRG